MEGKKIVFHESWGFPSHALGDKSHTIPPSGSQLALLSLTSCDALTCPQGMLHADGGFCLQSTSNRLCLIFSFFGFSAVHRLSPVGASRGYSLQSTGFSLRWLLLLRSTGSRVRAWQLWLTGLVALWHVGSSSTRGQTCIPCNGRWIFIHWTTREVLSQSM